MYMGCCVGKMFNLKLQMENDCLLLTVILAKSSFRLKLRFAKVF